MYKYIKYHIKKFFSDFFVKCAEYCGGKLTYYGVKYFLRTETVCMLEIYFDTTVKYVEYNPKYKWGALEESIKRIGLKKRIDLTKPSNKLKKELKMPEYIKYLIIDGNHRARILRKMYGIKYKFKCDIYLQEGEILKFNQW